MSFIKKISLVAIGKLALFLSYFILIAASPIQKQEIINPESATSLTQKEEIKTQKFMVISANPLASEAGYKILRKGGNAIDAAIATQMVLNVVEPQSSGIGGGGFLIYHDHKTNKNYYYNGRETAPRNIDPEIFLNEKKEPKEYLEALKGGASVATPGLLAMLNQAHEDHGKLPWFELFSDAIDVADLGFEISPRLNSVTAYATHLKEFPEASQIYLDKNLSPKQVTSIIKNPELADSFRKIAADNIKAFYQGELARDIVSVVNNSKINPGKLSIEDLNDYQVINAKSIKGNLICAGYRKYELCTMPLPSGGISVLEIMGILENFDLAKLKPNSTPSIHLISEAMRLGFADRNKYAADPKFIEIPNLLDKKYLKNRSLLIREDKALDKVLPGEFASLNSVNYAYFEPIFEPLSTSHISIIDQEGNAVSFTSSIEYAFGSGLMVDGFLLNNEMTDFSFVSEQNGKSVANRIEPGKQPRSAMSPIFVFDKKGNLNLVVGSPGGARIISYIVKTLVANLDWQMPIDKAIALPNFNKMNDILELEENSDLAILKPELEKLGHQVKFNLLPSGLHAIKIKKEGFFSGTDPRREGKALGE